MSKKVLSRRHGAFFIVEPSIERNLFFNKRIMIISNSYAMLNNHFIFHVFNVFFHALTSSSVEKRLRRVSGALLEYRHSPHRRSCIHIYTVSVLLISEFVAPFTIYNIPFLVSPPLRYRDTAENA